MAILRTLVLSALLCGAAQAKAAPISLQEQSRDLVEQMQQRGAPKGEIHLGLAGLYAKALHAKKVLAHLRAARKLGIAEIRTDLVLGTFYRRAGRYDAACSTLLRVLVNHSGQPYALVQLWKTLYEAKLRGQQVEVDLSTIRERLAVFGLHFPKELKVDAAGQEESKRITVRAYGALLAQRNRYAAQLFEAAIAAFPSNARAHRGLGIARARQRDYMRAAGAYLLYLELAPHAADADRVDRMLANFWRHRKVAR